MENLKVVGINCGHTLTGAGSGAVKYLTESIETRKVGEEVMRLLKKEKLKVIDCTIDKAATQSAYLAKVVELANDQTLDYFISIHFNAGGGKGVEVYTYEGRQFQDARDVCAKISELGFENRGVKEGTGLYVVSKTKAKSMLIEVCFVDTKSDANRYNSVGYKKIAKAIAEAILDYTIKGKEATEVVTANIKYPSDYKTGTLDKKVVLQKNSNIYKGPGTGYTVLDKFSKGKEVNVKYIVEDGIDGSAKAGYKKELYGVVDTGECLGYIRMQNVKLA